MNFGANKTPAEVIKEGAFIQVLMESGTETPGKNLVSWKILIRSIVCSNYYDVSVNEYGVKCGTSCRFW